MGHTFRVRYNTVHDERQLDQYIELYAPEILSVYFFVLRRFLRIMMLSVVETTKSAPVKFWFLEQFLSPEFKEMLPQFAEEYV